MCGVELNERKAKNSENS